MVLVLVAPIACHAQGGGIDSARVAQGIAGQSAGSTPAAKARAALYQTIRSGEFTAAGDIVVYMDLYGAGLGSGDWLTPSERLLTEVLLGDPRLIVRTARLDSLLAGWRDQSRQHNGFRDNLHNRLRDLLRVSSDASASLLDRWRVDEEERFFFTILVNHLTIRGIRGREELNRMIERFAAEFPESRLSEIARSRIAFVYRERPIGGAIHVGYIAGMFSDGLNERFRRFYGPSLGGEFYVWDLSLVVHAGIGVAEGRAPFIAGGRLWQEGEASLINIALDLGYEVRLGRLSLTPMGGLAIQDLRAVDSGARSQEERPMSGTRIGLDLSLLTGYRIAFDRGPHVDLRLRLGMSDATLETYDHGFDGALWYATLGVAVVFRPYVE